MRLLLHSCRLRYDLYENAMLKQINRLLRVLTVGLVAVLVSVGFAIAPAQANSDRLIQVPQSLIAYSVDYEMDKARAEQTIEHYGEPVREVVEEALQNNVNNPNSKETAENSYQRESPLNDLLPNRNSAGQKFSQDDFSEMQKIERPKDVLQK